MVAVVTHREVTARNREIALRAAAGEAPTGLAEIYSISPTTVYRAIQRHPVRMPLSLDLRREIAAARAEAAPLYRPERI